MAIAGPDLLRHLRPLGHAAAQADDLLRVLLLGVGQGAQGAVYPLFRMVPDGAGVHHHNVRPGGIVGELAPHVPQHPQDMLAVGHVLLAPEGVHQSQRRPAPGLVHGVDFSVNSRWRAICPSSRSTCFLSNGNLPAAPCREKGGTSLI